ncbi:Phosphatidylinositol transfer protein 2 [Porphyridium purpureum]|uniref:Phosphatidylinositol transfer protein 2 n=1 Tax=Porphyridium purpureum TaxID=35688 RepID=A0A5J4Z789_PORPP|nr:Phosphatidylinositol transfer protein 2 [Porphyridium purpureum]|eukprot:POR9045..scf295_1
MGVGTCFELAHERGVGQVGVRCWRGPVVDKMLTVEYHIPVPLTTEEYRIGMMYMIAKSSLQEAMAAQDAAVSKASRPIHIRRNEPYYANEHGLPNPGQYTEKKYNLRAHLPKFVAAMVPESASYVVEYAWNAFPVCRTTYEAPMFGEKFVLTIDSIYADDQTAASNKFGLSKKELSERQVCLLDMCSEEFVPFESNSSENPTLWKSTKASRGGIKKDFWKTAVSSRASFPLMYAYKLVRLEFRKLGLQTKVEQWGQRYGMRNNFIRYTRRIVCWADEWYGLSMEDVRQMEDQATALTGRTSTDTEDVELECDQPAVEVAV